MLGIDFDRLFFYGEGQISLNDENEFDIWQGVLQPQKSLLYFRQEGAGLYELENRPNYIALMIKTGYAVVNWAAFRNSYVSNGSNNQPDRRVAISQQTVVVQQDTQRGLLDVEVGYIPFGNIQKTATTIPLK
jgi:hypothetical protein